MTTLTLARTRPLALLLIGALALGGCSNLSRMEQRMLTGGAIGTTAGVVGTAITGGCIACGAAIGGAVGVGSGYLYDYIDSQD